MQYAASTPKEYIEQLPEDRKEPLRKLRAAIRKNLPAGFKEEMSYGMIGYVVPYSVYPAGYHCDTSLPLPFMSIASQKNFVAVYHMGVYADEKLMRWFTTEYAKRVPVKLDMGKSCIRFKKIEHIPYDLIGELAGKITVKQWIKLYEENLKDSRKKK